MCHFRFSVYKGYPLVHRINNIIITLQENGLINKWTQDLTIDRRKFSNNNKKPLTLNQLQTAFYILISGYGVSLLFLLGEYLYFKYKIYFLM